jgi:hypothetical protein
MAITQSRLHRLLTAAEQFQQLFEATELHIAHEAKLAASGQQSWETALGNVALALHTTNILQPSLVLAEERRAYDLTVRRNDRTRARKQRQRRAAGIPARPPAGEATLADAPAHIHAEYARASALMQQLDAEDPSDADPFGPAGASPADPTGDAPADPPGTSDCAPAYTTLTPARKAELDRLALAVVQAGSPKGR